MIERDYIRELAKLYMQIANSEKNAERITRMRKMNSLQTGVRPPVLVHEVPWHEMPINLQCQTPELRNIELILKKKLYQWENFQGDMLALPFYEIKKHFTDSGNGIVVKEETLSTDSTNNIVSHEYIDIMKDDDDLAKMHKRVLTKDVEADKKAVEFAEEIFGDILPVRLKGNLIYYVPWDDISRWRSVSELLIDLLDNEDFMHRLIAKMTDIQQDYMLQLEKLDLLDNDIEYLHCTPGFTDDLPPLESDGKVRLKNVWFRGAAQIFDSVSPATQEEFEFHYVRPLMEQCGLTYYGCCEALHRKIDLVKTLPNLRKVGVSPWADVNSSAEQLGKNYVLARKPNPAFVATSFDEQTVEKEIVETVQAALRYNCPYEFVLKDISTVNNHPEHLNKWVATVQKVLDRYYN